MHLSQSPDQVSLQSQNITHRLEWRVHFQWEVCNFQWEVCMSCKLREVGPPFLPSSIQKLSLISSVLTNMHKPLFSNETLAGEIFSTVYWETRLRRCCFALIGSHTSDPPVPSRLTSLLDSSCLPGWSARGAWSLRCLQCRKWCASQPANIFHFSFSFCLTSSL